VSSGHTIDLAVVQMACNGPRAANLDAAEAAVRRAAAEGAQVVLLPELFEGPYFPQVEREDAFDLAAPVDAHPTVARFAALAADLGVVLPLSVFEAAGPAYYNTVVMIDADGSRLGTYRKAHVPDGPGYEEKYYFAPGDTGFRVWATAAGRLGVGICWDQWFPEAARAMALAGAEVLLYPTAIGSEPPEAGGVDTRAPWRRVMVGHAVANVLPVAAANRVGVEDALRFYGTSFVVDAQGEVLCEAGETESTVLHARVDVDADRRLRAGYGFFRDRRPELYGALRTRDGVTPVPGAGDDREGGQD